MHGNYEHRYNNKVCTDQKVHFFVTFLRVLENEKWTGVFWK